MCIFCMVWTFRSIGVLENWIFGLKLEIVFITLKL